MSEIVLVKGKIIPGYGVASGKGGDVRFPEGTIALQLPYFKNLGLDLGHFFTGTLNISISPFKFKLTNPSFTFKNVKWTDKLAEETFSFSPCELVYLDKSYSCYIYYPHPETKPDHIQPDGMIEIIGPKINGLGYGSEVELRLNSGEVIVFE